MQTKHGINVQWFSLTLAQRLVTPLAFVQWVVAVAASARGWQLEAVQLPGTCRAPVYQSLCPRMSKSLRGLWAHCLIRNSLEGLVDIQYLFLKAFALAWVEVYEAFERISLKSLLDTQHLFLKAFALAWVEVYEAFERFTPWQMLSGCQHLETAFWLKI